ncbi:uncharacterized protein METZ01_LOCUS119394 [marine metagenome]|uniref:Uncharacterized protein n=1 Tax=marine metagenome TaxID=408172 RepID=A0A381XPF7_9ZZZZ
MRTKTVFKLGVGAVLLVGVPWLFLKTIRSTIAEPYSIDRTTLTEWTLHIDETGAPGPAVMTLVPARSLVPQLFQQVFQRTMESLTTPVQAGMPVVLQSEFLTSLQNVFTPAEILVIAKAAGLEDLHFEPVCMAVKREPFGGGTRQLFFVVFEASGFMEFRQELARRYREAGGVAPFEAAAIDLVLPIASTDANFAQWWPLAVDREVDCRAPIM